MSRIKPDIGKFSYLGFWAGSLPKNWTVFNCYLLSKHPSKRLIEKNCSILGRIKGEIARKSSAGNLKTAFYFQRLFGYFSQILPKIEQFYKGMFV